MIFLQFPRIFQSSLEKEIKGNKLFAERTLKCFECFAIGSLDQRRRSREGGGRGMLGRESGRPGAARLSHGGGKPRWRRGAELRRGSRREMRMGTCLQNHKSLGGCL